MINISPLLKLIGILALVIGAIAGVINIISSAPFLVIVTSTVPFFIGAVLFYAFGELLDSVNAIKKKLIGEITVQNSAQPSDSTPIQQ